jgi:very-long-chain enoyl-CoA reductase
MVFNRQRIILPVEGQAKPLVLADEKKTLADYGVSEGAKLRLKDLGPQVAYRWLYLWEYVSFRLRVQSQAYNQGGVIFLNPALFWLSQTRAGSIVPTWGPYQPSDLQ